MGESVNGVFIAAMITAGHHPWGPPSHVGWERLMVKQVAPKITMKPLGKLAGEMVIFDVETWDTTSQRGLWDRHV